MTRIFLIDLENVQSSGLEGIEQLSPDDKVLIFYSDKADNLKIDLVKKINDCKADVDYIHADNGTPNSLDFQLITWLYYSIDTEKEYWIISKDTGYEASIKMAKRLGSTNVHRAPAIINAVHYAQKNAALKARAERINASRNSSVENVEKAEEKKNAEPAENIQKSEVPAETGEVIADHSVEQKDETLTDQIHSLLMNQCKLDADQSELSAVQEALLTSENKNQFYQYFRKHMGTEKGSAFYKQIRSQFNALKELTEQTLPF